MPTLLNGTIEVTIGNGVSVAEEILKEQPDDILHALSVAFQYFRDCIECQNHWCGGMKPFDSRCNCSLPMDEFLKLRDAYRAKKRSGSKRRTTRQSTPRLRTQCDNCCNGAELHHKEQCPVCKRVGS